MTDPRLPVVLLWHMHQPPYRDALSGRYVLPWTYLHAIKDYTDMAAHLEEVPGAKAVVNFTPVLIAQIEDLTAAVRGCLVHGAPLPDALLATLGPAPLPQDPPARLSLLRACLRADRENLIRRHAPFEELVQMAQSFDAPERIGYTSDQSGLVDEGLCLTSLLVSIPTMITSQIDIIAAGEFGGLEQPGLAEGVIGIAPYSTKVSAEIQQQVETVKQSLIDGTLTLTPDYSNN